jgi:hypothetical protein
MQASLNNFLYFLKQLVTGEGPVDGGILVDGQSVLDSAESASGQTTLAEANYVVPRNYDEASDHLKLNFTGRMDGTTDTPDVDVVVTLTRKGESDSTIQSSTTVFSLDDSYDDAVLDLSGNGLQRGDFLDIAITIGSHSTDGVERLSVRPEYRSTLVSYDDGDDANGNPLR